MAQNFQHYMKFNYLRTFLEGNQRCLDNSTELDNFIAGLIHSGKVSIVSQEERISNDPMLQQKFTQGAIVSVILLYMDELRLQDGPSPTST